MCQSIRYIYKNVEYTVSQSDARPLLPVRLKNGDTRRILWGRGPDQPGDLPFGYTIPLTDIRAGLWADYSPRPLLIPFQSFTINDRDGESSYCGNQNTDHIQGLLATAGREHRLYVVTVLPDLANQSRFDHWPRTIGPQHLPWDEKSLKDSVDTSKYRIKITPPTE